MKRPKQPTPFDVNLTDEERTKLGGDLTRDIEDALTARGTIINAGGLIDLADWFYEQGRSDEKDRPFVGAADLTSYFIFENVASYKARLVQAAFGVRPFCFVEGKGQDAKKAPAVEEFMDWKVRESTLPADLAKTVLGALLEDCYILEVSEKVETRRLTETVKVALDLHPETGAPVFTDGKPKLKMDEQGEPVLAQEGDAHAQVQRTHTKTRRLGPKYDPISMKDFVFLPGHAKKEDAIWGYAYRVWERVPELEERVEDGIYDAKAVERLGTSSDREMDSTTQTTTSDIAPQYDGAVEKELFQLSLKRDFDGDGREEWYVATVSLKSRELLRLKLDTFAQKYGSRCVPFIFFPRRNSVYGYSYAFDHLLTLAEEHTSVRNMKADVGALKTNAPTMQVVGGLWDADAEPFGVGRIIHVRDHNELAARSRRRPGVHCRAGARAAPGEGARRRPVGLGSRHPVGERRTLGENKLVAGGSAVRVKEVTGYLHAAMARVMKLTHAIWVETLEADPKGMEAPDRVAKALSLTDGKFTAEMIRGDFQFEPYGSDETADPERRKADFNAGLQALNGLAQTNPVLGQVLQHPEVVQATLEQWLRVFEVRDREPFLNALKAIQEAAKAAAQQQAAMMPGGIPGAPMAGGPGGAPGGMPGGMPPALAAILGGGAPTGGGM
jgi:hypothetical protein